MKRFSIAEVEAFTDIKAHTIRIWELRYQICVPERTTTNIRLYTIDQIRSILNIALLNHLGHKISYLASLNNEELGRLLAQQKSPEIKKSVAVGELIVALFSRDTERFESLLIKSTVELGLDETIRDVIVPFLERIQLLHYNDSSPEIHFAVAAIRGKLILGLEQQTRPQLPSKLALLFLPRGEHFDLLLLYMNYQLRAQGIRTLYLGTNVSEEDLKAACEQNAPAYLVTYLPPKHKLDLALVSRHLTTQCPSASLILTGFTNDVVPHAVGHNIKIRHYRDVASAAAINRAY